MALNARGAAPQQKYDVFLSFRGEDTRKGFTTDLYKRLQKKGLASFMDDEKLKRGEVISPSLLQAIEESSISIVILSQNYAFSTWCLDELQKIVETRKELGQGVLPVFYAVDPSEVRHQRGSFEKAFARHEEVYRGSREKVRRWRDALTEVANTSGWHLGEPSPEAEAELIEDIAEYVWNKLRPKLPSTFDILAGVDSKVEGLDKQARTELGKFYSQETCCFIL